MNLKIEEHEYEQEKKRIREKKKMILDSETVDFPSPKIDELNKDYEALI
jgi:hypothetical protein